MPRSLNHFCNLQRFLQLSEKRGSGRRWGGEKKRSFALLSDGPVGFADIFFEGFELLLGEAGRGESRSEEKKGWKEKEQPW